MLILLRSTGLWWTVVLKTKDLNKHGFYLLVQNDSATLSRREIPVLWKNTENHVTVFRNAVSKRWLSLMFSQQVCPLWYLHKTKAQSNWVFCLHLMICFQSPQTRRTRMHWEQRSSNVCIRVITALNITVTEICVISRMTSSSWPQRNREHPLDPDSEELSESDDEVQIRSRSRVEPKSELPASHVTVHGSLVSALGEETEIEMEVRELDINKK